MDDVLYPRLAKLRREASTLGQGKIRYMFCFRLFVSPGLVWFVVAIFFFFFANVTPE